MNIFDEFHALSLVLVTDWQAAGFFQMPDDKMRKAIKQEVAQASLVNPFVRSCLVFECPRGKSA